MEVNKEQSERCRDMGAQALKQGDHARAIKMLSKSLQLYELPGVASLLHQAQQMQKQSSSSANTSSSSNSASNNNNNRASAETARPAAASTTEGGSNGRSYTDAQVKIVEQVLKAKKGGRGAHYRVLGISQSANESEIKKAYRKLSLKIHPDKNPAPHADDAFKAVGLAYATLSDENKRTIYDRYGDEDPDQVGGGGGNPFAGMRRRGGGGGGVHMNGQHMNPEDIFNAFFHGGMGGGGGGGGFAFGPGVHFYGGGFPNNMRQPRGRANAQGQQQQQQQGGVTGLMQFLPIIAMLFLMLFNNSEPSQMPGVGKYFSLTQEPPFVNELKTRYSTVKEIPFYVSGRFLRTYYRDRYQLNQVEQMVERAYERFLMEECQKQSNYQTKLHRDALRVVNEAERRRKLQIAEEFELGRCRELYQLFPHRKKA